MTWHRSSSSETVAWHAHAVSSGTVHNRNYTPHQDMYKMSTSPSYLGLIVIHTSQCMGRHKNSHLWICSFVGSVVCQALGWTDDGRSLIMYGCPPLMACTPFVWLWVWQIRDVSIGGMKTMTDDQLIVPGWLSLCRLWLYEVVHGSCSWGFSLPSDHWIIKQHIVHNRPMHC